MKKFLFALIAFCFVLTTHAVVEYDVSSDQDMLTVMVDNSIITSQVEGDVNDYLISPNYTDVDIGLSVKSITLLQNTQSSETAHNFRYRYPVYIKYLNTSGQPPSLNHSSDIAADMKVPWKNSLFTS